MAKIYHAEIFGSREAKYSWLNKNDIKKVKWKKIEPKPKFYLFHPIDDRKYNTYNNFFSIKDTFYTGGTGIVTKRDKLAIQPTKELALQSAKDVLSIPESALRSKYELPTDVRDWKYEWAKADIRTTGISINNVKLILYRPFDHRFIYYTGNSRGFIGWPVFEIMQHMFNENVGIICPRQFKELPGAFISETIIGHKTVSAYDINSLFPLYLYPSTDKKDLFSDHESGEKKPNIKQELFAELKTKYKKEVTPEEIFYYIYAVLYSNTYRTKYAEFLKIDFPRIPFTSNYKLFIQLGKLGKQLADLHLLKSHELSKPISKFSGKGDNKVTQRPKYENEKVYINATQYFTNVKEEVWNYQIGGYQVCDKWLKDRKDRELSLDEIQTYCKIVTALSKTIEFQKKIDENYIGIET